MRPRSLASLLHISRSSAVTVCTVPTLADARLLLAALPEATNDARRTLTVTHQPGAASAPDHRFIVPPRSRTAEASVASLRTLLRRERPFRWLVVDAGTEFGPWTGSRPALRKFFLAVVRLAESLEVRLVWVAARNRADDQDLAAWKDEAGFFLHITRTGTSLTARFLAAGGVTDPGFFDPFPLALSAGESTGAEPGARTPPAPSTEPDHAEIFRHAPEGLVAFSLTGPYRSANAAALSLLGVDEEQFRTITIPDLVAEDSLLRAARILLLLRRRRRAEGLVRMRRGSTARRILGVTAHLLAGEVVVAVLRDATNAERAGRMLAGTGRMQEDVLRSTPHPSVVFHNRKAVYWNEAFRRAFPVLSARPQADLTPARLFGRGGQSLARTVTTIEEGGAPGPVRAEAALRDGEGDPVWYDITATGCDMGGRSAVHCQLVECGERRRTLDALRESEEHFRRIVEQSPEPIALTEEGVLRYANPPLMRILGVPAPADVEGKTLDDVFRRVDRRERPGRNSAGRHGAPAVSLTAEVVRKDGSRIILEAVEGKVAPGEGAATVLVFRDVTARSDEERRFRTDQKAMQAVRDLDTAAGSTLDHHELARALFSAFLKVVQCPAGLVALPVPGSTSVVTLEDVGIGEKAAAALAAQTTGEGLYGFLAKTQEPLILRMEEYPPHLPLKSVFSAEGWKTAILVPLVEKEALRAILFAATDRVAPPAPHIEEALRLMVRTLGARLASAESFSELRAAEERYRSAVESITDVIYQTAPTGVLVFLSPNVERLLGYPPEDFYRAPDLWRTIVHPDDRTRYAQRIAQQNVKTDAFHLEYRMLPKGKATYRWVRDAVRYERGAGGELVSVTGIVSDITDRVELEAALMKSEELKTNVLESVQEGVMVLDRSFTVIDWNGAMEGVTGVLRESAIGKRVAEAAPGVLDERILRVLEDALAGEAGSTDDLPVPASGEAERFLWVRCSPLRDSSGMIRGVVGIITDISGRRRLEREVRESEETLRNVIDAMGDALMISDLQGRVWEVNREFTRITGYQRSEVLGFMFPYPWVLDDEMAQFVTWIAALREQNYLRDFDMTWQRRDGSRVAISLNTTMLRNALGEPVAMLNIARDITDRRRLSLELETRNRELLALNAISTSISTSLELPEVLRVAAGQIRELLGADMILFYLRNVEGKGLDLAHAVGLEEGMDVAVAELPTDGSATGAVVRDRLPLYIGESLLDDPRVTPQGRAVLQQLGINSLGVIPLQSKEKVLGALDVAFRQPHDFHPRERQLLLLIGNQIGPAIENAQLYEEVQAQVQRITVLYELGRRLTGLLDAASLLAGVDEEAARAIPYAMFACYRRNEEDGKFEPLYHTRREGTGGDPRTLDLAEASPLRRVLGGQSLLDRDRSVPELDAGSTIAVPLHRRERVEGFLLVTHGDTGRFNTAHLRLLESIGNLTEIALEKASLYEDTIAKSREIEERNKELDDFTYVVSHDLKEPLISIEGYSKILMNDYQASVDEDGKEYLRSVVQSTNRMKSLIDDLLTMSRLGRVPEAVHPVPVGQVLAEILQELRFTMEERGVEVAVPAELPEVRYNATQLAMVFRNLITNAIKFNDKPRPAITITWIREAGHHVFSVADNGIGIDRAYFDKIFMIFQRLHRGEEYRGTGAGLTIVKKIVEKHHGRVWVDSEVGRGTTFSFTVPV